MPKARLKRAGAGFEIKTFDAESGTIVVFRTGREFHVFRETTAKDAAIEAGRSIGLNMPERGNTRAMWETVWRELKRGPS
ncbi:MAG TPA: hypothetical protein VIC54_02340 [Terriglobales bacterium]|jgi:hypothetical protein